MRLGLHDGFSVHFSLPVYLGKRRDALIPEFLRQFYKNKCCTLGIVYRPVVMPQMHV